MMRRYLSPAKLNLFLHVIGRRQDGYHNLQTLFQLLNWGDEMTFSPNHSGQITVDCNDPSVTTEDNLAYRAAVLLQRQSRAHQCGVDISLQKRIPTGAGLGGGSSNAATTLLALNELWQINLHMTDLMAMGRTLGADVPVFLEGHSAWAEGIGEQLTPVTLPHWDYLIVKPPVSIATREIFQAEELTRDTPAITIATFFEGRYRNDCEAVVLGRYPAVQEVFEALAPHGRPRLTGTGSCVFLQCQSPAHAVNIASKMPADSQTYVVQGVNQSPALAAME